MILCRYGRKEHEGNKRIHREPAESRQRKRPDEYLIQETRLRVASNNVRDWQVNK